MRRALAEAKAVDEVAGIRDKALAMELYLRQRNDPEPERRVCEIRLRAERKLAAVPEAQFEAALAAPAKPSTKGIIASAAAASTLPKPAVEPVDEQALWGKHSLVSRRPVPWCTWASSASVGRPGQAVAGDPR